MTVNAISVISAHDIHCKDKVIQKRIGTETEFSTKVIFVELFIKTFGIILVCTLLLLVQKYKLLMILDRLIDFDAFEASLQLNLQIKKELINLSLLSFLITLFIP